MFQNGEQVTLKPEVDVWSIGRQGVVVFTIGDCVGVKMAHGVVRGYRPEELTNEKGQRA